MDNKEKIENLQNDLRRDENEMREEIKSAESTMTTEEAMPAEDTMMTEEVKPAEDKGTTAETKPEEAKLIEEKVPAEANNIQDAAEASGTTVESPVRVPKKRGKRVALAVLAAAVLLVVIYSGIGIYYRSHFLPNTFVQVLPAFNDIDCSGLTAVQAASLMDAQVQEYTLTVTGRDYATGNSGAVLGTIAPGDIQLGFEDTLSSAKSIMEYQEWLLWIKSVNSHSDRHSLIQGVTYDEELLENVVRGWDACQSKNMLAAQDAYISQYSEELKGFEVVPETNGTELDMTQVLEAVTAALEAHETSLDLEAAGLYKTAKILQDDTRLTDPVKTANSWLGTKITYDWNGDEVVLDEETIRDWVSIEDGEAVLDEEAVASFVSDQAREHNTYGKKKKFTTALGVELTLNSPNYGWRTDSAGETEELIRLIQEGTVTSREPLYAVEAKAKSTENDIGDSYVELDLTNQHMYLFQDGMIVLESDFVSGNVSAGNATPQGIFGVTYKTTNAILRGEDYATPVNYWMPFYGNYGMHDATWRGTFGGSIYLTNGSHGCINLPLSKAKQLYQYVSAGFPVICYHYPAPVTPPEPEVTAPEAAAPEATQDPAAGEQTAGEQPAA